jgi:hypothetical protein
LSADNPAAYRLQTRWEANSPERLGVLSDEELSVLRAPSPVTEAREPTAGTALAAGTAPPATAATADMDTITGTSRFSRRGRERAGQAHRDASRRDRGHGTPGHPQVRLRIESNATPVISLQQPTSPSATRTQAAAPARTNYLHDVVRKADSGQPHAKGNSASQRDNSPANPLRGLTTPPRPYWRRAARACVRSHPVDSG